MDETDRDVRGDPEDAIHEDQASIFCHAPQGLRKNGQNEA
jgi:hypothetical protein